MDLRVIVLYVFALHACFVGAAAAAPTKHAGTGTFVHMLGDFSIYSRA
jgi:hypothetical protein